MTLRMPLVVAAALLIALGLTPAAWAENQMGYHLLTPATTASLPRNRGTLGLMVERAQQITDSGMTFDLIRVRQVRQGSAGARAGLEPGDQIIAVDGQVFSSLVVFGTYIGSLRPGARAVVDYLPANGGPAQAQRVSVIIGSAADGAATPAPQSAEGGMSTGAKVAIGVGAAALFGCYELGCFSHKRPEQPGVPTGR